jgi:peptidyl-prolyl cis-trans isomerase C
MKLFSISLTVLCSVFVSVVGIAQELDIDLEILAKRGKGVVTQTAFVARANKIPEASRFATLRNGKRFTDAVNSMLLYDQLAADAKEAGFDQQKVIMDRMQLAATKELGEAWLEHYITLQPTPDFEMLAYEYYQVHKDELKTAPTINVSHILISTKERSNESALELAKSLRQQINSDPSKFDSLVTEYSEDPSAPSNKGKFEGVKKGDMVPEFDHAAFLLEPGQISEPVETGYGYHIIRLNAQNPAKTPGFESVKSKIIESQRTSHVDRIKEDYVGGLTSIPVDMSTDAMREMVIRVFGEKYIDQQTDIEEKE